MVMLFAMTSQQIVFNKSCLAIASDSMVSIGRNFKTFPSVNKLFSMGNRHSVGLMICGCAAHIPSGVSWERIFNLFNDQELNSRDTMAEYVESFRTFISDFEKAEDTSELNKKQIKQDLDNHFTNLISPAAEREELLNVGPMARYIAESEEIQEVISAALEDRVDELIQQEIKIYEWKQEKGHLEAFRKAEKQVSEYWKPLVEEAGDFFCKRHGCAHIIKKIKYLFNKKLYNAMDHTWRETSQIVIAGFGKKELTPSVWTFDVSTDLTIPEYQTNLDGGSFGKWTCYKIRSPTDPNDRGKWHDISEKGDLGTTWSTWGTNLSFAQNDASIAFLMGINDYSRSTLNREIPSFYLHDMFPKIVSTICSIDTLSESEISRIREVMDGFVKPHSTEELYNYVDYLTTELRNRRQSQFDRIIIHLPQKELCELAGKLVELESTASQFANPGLPSVGGDIDIAVITKEEGFRWVSKK
jgi:hypothetical protein